MLYKIKDIKKKNYAILCYSAEDYWEYSIVSLHDELEKAQKRCKFLNKRNEGYKNFLGGFQVITTDELLTNKKYAYMFDEED